MFLGANVRTLKLETDVSDSDVHISSTRRALARCSKHLTSLDITGTELIDYVVSPPGLAFPEVTTLALGLPSPAAFAHLATWPKLTNLDVYRVVTPPDVGIPKSFPPVSPAANAFPALQVISCWYAVNLSDLVHVLRLLPPGNEVHTVEWVCGSYPSPAEAKQVISAVARYCNPATLKHLKLSVFALSGTGFFSQQNEPLEMSPEEIDLAPLREFHSLEHLFIEVGVSVRVTPQVLEQVPSIWPRIQTLVLSAIFPNALTPLVNHEHTLTLVDALPALCDLGLRFDASRVLGSERPAHLRSQLKVLRVGKSPICSPFRVTELLKGCFPKLEMLVASDDGAENSNAMDIIKSRWKLVWQELFPPSLVL
jgi:hypothetical protein